LLDHSPNTSSTSDIYTLSLHDALPIYEEVLSGIPDRGQRRSRQRLLRLRAAWIPATLHQRDKERRSSVPSSEWDRQFLLFRVHQDRKSTRLNSSHVAISYAVFCLKKKT